MRLPSTSKPVTILGHNRIFGIRMSLPSIWKTGDREGTAVAVLQLARSLIGHLLAPTAALVGSGAIQLMSSTGCGYRDG